MKAFHNDPAIKEKYLARVRAHREADNLIHGIGWDGGKGCAIGCTLESYDHSRYPIELGIPEWLAHLEDRLFEGLPKIKAMEWPERFLEAIHVGSDLDKIKNPFLVFVLESTLDKFDHAKFPRVKQAIDNVISLLNNPNSTSDDFIEARKNANAAYASAAYAAAYAATYAAADAAYAAANAAAAADAAADADTAYAARATSYAAYAHAYIVRFSEYNKFADKLIELIKGEK